MQKTDFINELARKTGLSKKDIVAVVEAYSSTVTEVLQSGDSLSLKGFGTFKPARHKARIGRNPKTKEPMEIAAYVSPSFKPSKVLKDAMKSET
ncbi:DNA-binding protein HU (plasmid) [Oscillibacter valericigenes Sjm18-20]|nr:DNA-binding protein HU [Oscillibacter valericigenes Sjm18-20]